MKTTDTIYTVHLLTIVKTNKSKTVTDGGYIQKKW